MPKVTMVTISQTGTFKEDDLRNLLEKEDRYTCDVCEDPITDGNMIIIPGISNGMLLVNKTYTPIMSQPMYLHINCIPKWMNNLIL